MRQLGMRLQRYRALNSALDGALNSTLNSALNSALNSVLNSARRCGSWGCGCKGTRFNSFTGTRVQILTRGVLGMRPQQRAEAALLRVKATEVVAARRSSALNSALIAP